MRRFLESSPSKSTGVTPMKGILRLEFFRLRHPFGERPVWQRQPERLPHAEFLAVGPRRGQKLQDPCARRHVLAVPFGVFQSPEPHQFRTAHMRHHQRIVRDNPRHVSGEADTVRIKAAVLRELGARRKAATNFTACTNRRRNSEGS